jgi:hypothetical protein
MMRNSRIDDVLHAGRQPQAARGARQGGFAIITALLVLVAISALAVGAFFLTSTNLQLAQNVRTQAVAKYNSEKWLDVALIMLADGYVKLDRLPTRTELEPFLIQSDEFEITRYSVNSSGTVGEIQVTGRALRGESGGPVARHPVSARFEGARASGASNAGPGFISGQDIEIDGASTFMLNMHAGRDLTISGNTKLGPLFSYMSGTETCDLGTAGECLKNQPPPYLPPLVWEDEHKKLFDEYCADQPIHPVPHNSFTFGVVAPNSVICLPESGHFIFSDVSVLKNVTIVGGPFTRVTLEAGSGGINPEAGEDQALRLIAGDIILAPGKELSNRNQVMARGNVILNRGVTYAPVEEIDEDGVKRIRAYVQTLIRAGNDIVFAGSGGSGTYAKVIANGKFCRSGTGGGRFFGTIIAAAGDAYGTEFKSQNYQCGAGAAIAFKGGGSWTASLPDGFDIDEPDIIRPVGISVIARRP